MKDGGPAFPHAQHGDYGSYSGMSLRDYFAGQTIIGISVVWFPGKPSESDMNLAKRTYEIADALLAEREKE